MTSSVTTNCVKTIENLYSPRMVVYNKKTKINTIQYYCNLTIFVRVIVEDEVNL